MVMTIEHVEDIGSHLPGPVDTAGCPQVYIERRVGFDAARGRKGAGPEARKEAARETVGAQRRVIAR